jgi:DNA-directed RNA polymerase subunit RPC12/RpoP
VRSGLPSHCGLPGDTALLPLVGGDISLDELPVRGLLCTRCNKRIDDPRGWPWPRDFAYSAAYYLAHVWYLRPGSTTVVRRKKPVGSDFKFGTRYGEQVMHSLPGWRYGRNVADCGVVLSYRFESGDVDGYTPCTACRSRREQKEHASQFRTQATNAPLNH